MTPQQPATEDTTADSISDPNEEREQISSPGGFLQGEWRNLWPVWTLGVIFVALIVAASLSLL
jgi:hypothetical protein